MQNIPCHFEFLSKNPEKTRDFYRALFNWRWDEDRERGYHKIGFGSETNVSGGLLRKSDAASCPGGVIYFSVDDVAAAAQQVGKAGGQILVPRQEIKGLGCYAVARDPDGNLFGLWQKSGR